MSRFQDVPNSYAGHCSDWRIAFYSATKKHPYFGPVTYTNETYNCKTWRFQSSLPIHDTNGISRSQLAVNNECDDANYIIFCYSRWYTKNSIVYVPCDNKCPFYQHWLTFMPAWVYDHMASEVCCEMNAQLKKLPRLHHRRLRMDSEFYCILSLLVDINGMTCSFFVIIH